MYTRWARVQIIILIVMLGLSMWRIYALEVEQDLLATSHASFVSYCRNTVALLAEQKRTGKCPELIAEMEKP